MIINSSILIIIVVALFAFYLIYSQNSAPKNKDCSCSNRLNDPLALPVPTNSGNEPGQNYQSPTSLPAYFPPRIDQNDYILPETNYGPSPNKEENEPDLLLHGVLIIQENERNKAIAHTIPLFKTKESGRENQSYYITDRNNPNAKIGLQNIRINNISQNNSNYRHLFVLHNNDIVEDLPKWPNTQFKVMLHKTY